MNDFTLTIKVVVKKDNGNTYIEVQIINLERFQNFGFGTFLCDITLSEIGITQEAMDILIGCPERSGLQELEFWEEKRLAWGSKSLCFLIPPNHINVPNEAKTWIKEMSLIK